MSDDPYAYPGTSVLRNTRGIREPDALRRIEADLTSARAVRLAAHPLPGRYDLGHLRAFHRALFEGLYDWAGELRTVPIAKPHSLFALPQHIDSYGRAVFDALARERHLAGLAHDAFIARLAHYLGDVNALHPFREGNGRVQRAFFGQLAADVRSLGGRRVAPRLDLVADVALPGAEHRLAHDPARAWKIGVDGFLLERGQLGVLVVAIDRDVGDELVEVGLIAAAGTHRSTVIVGAEPSRSSASAEQRTWPLVKRPTGRCRQTVTSLPWMSVMVHGRRAGTVA